MTVVNGNNDASNERHQNNTGTNLKVSNQQIRKKIMTQKLVLSIKICSEPVFESWFVLSQPL